MDMVALDVLDVGIYLLQERAGSVLKMVMKIIPHWNPSEIFVVDRGRPQVGQLARIDIFMRFKQMPGDEQVQHRVTQEFQPLEDRLDVRDPPIFFFLN